MFLQVIFTWSFWKGFMRKTLFVVSPQPASYFSPVTSHSGCTSVILQAPMCFRKRATAVQRTAIFLFPGCGGAIGPAERYPGEQGEKRRRGADVGV